MKVHQVDIPSHSALLKDSKTYDYVDSYQSLFTDIDNNITCEDIGRAFFSSAPNWTTSLFTLRNKIVGIFGLKTAAKPKNRAALLQQFRCEPGDRLGFFRVYEKSEDEVIMGEDDKHLNFRVSLMKEEKMDGGKNLTISTVVEFNNWFGRLYFMPVKPFHKLIVPTMLKATLKHLQQN